MILNNGGNFYEIDIMQRKNIFIIATEEHGTTRTCRENTRKFRMLLKKHPAKFVSFVERLRSLNLRERKIRFFCLIRC